MEHIVMERSLMLAGLSATTHDCPDQPQGGWPAAARMVLQRPRRSAVVRSCASGPRRRRHHRQQHHPTTIIPQLTVSSAVRRR